MSSLYAPTRILVDIYLHIFSFLFGLAIFGCISILVLPFATLFGMGSIESAISVGLVCFFVSRHILLPRWSAGRYQQHGPKRAINLKDLATDTYVVVDDNDKLSLDQDCQCCSICLCDLCGSESATRGRVCGHIFHEECLTMWVNKSATCPYCRQDLKIDSTTKSDIHKAGMWGIFDGVFDSIYSWTNSPAYWRKLIQDYYCRRSWGYSHHPPPGLRRRDVHCRLFFPGPFLLHGTIYNVYNSSTRWHIEVYQEIHGHIRQNAIVQIYIIRCQSLASIVSKAWFLFQKFCKIRSVLHRFFSWCHWGHHAPVWKTWGMKNLAIHFLVLTDDRAGRWNTSVFSSFVSLLADTTAKASQQTAGCHNRAGSRRSKVHYSNSRHSIERQHALMILLLKSKCSLVMHASGGRSFN